VAARLTTAVRPVWMLHMGPGMPVRDAIVEVCAVDVSRSLRLMWGNVVD
jgi:hypothetical protein